MGSKGVSKYDDTFKKNQTYGKWLIINEKILNCREIESKLLFRLKPRY